MSRVLAMMLLGGSLLLSGLAVTPSQGTPLYADGQKQAIKGAEDLGSTILGYVMMPGLPLIGVCLALSGLGSLGQFPAKGITKIGSGVSAGFIPAFIKPGSDYANSAASDWLPVLAATWPDVVGTLLMQALLLTILYAWARRSHVAHLCDRV